MIATFVPWFFYICALVTTAYLKHFEHYSLGHALLLSVIFFNGGIQSLWSSLGHLLSPEKTAQAIGWKSSGFQTEVGFTNLAIGVASVLCIWHYFWLIPVALIRTIFLLGCVYTHIKDRIVNKNQAPCNSGPMLYCSIIIALTLIIGMILSY